MSRPYAPNSNPIFAVFYTQSTFQIIRYLMKKEMTLEELQNLKITNTYRSIQFLREKKLVKIKHYRLEKNCKVTVFGTDIKNIRVDLEKNIMEILK